jgi:hypothetical protein
MSSRSPTFSAVAMARMLLRRRNRRLSWPRCSAARRLMTKKRSATTMSHAAARSRRLRWLSRTRPRRPRRPLSTPPKRFSSGCRCHAPSPRALRPIRSRRLIPRLSPRQSSRSPSGRCRPTNTPRNRRSISSTPAASGIMNPRRSQPHTGPDRSTQGARRDRRSRPAVDRKPAAECLAGSGLCTSGNTA